MSEWRRVAVLLAVVAAGCGSEPPPPRNLLLLAVDTLRPDRLGGYGYERDTSPHIDAFPEQSMVFEDAQSVSSWTLPAFAAVFTSLYPSTTRCWDFQSRLDVSHTTLAEILAERGYRTAAIVSHVFMKREYYGLDQGFQDYDDELALGMAASHGAVTSPAINDRALAWLRAHAEAGDERPFFMWLHDFDPHHRYQEHEGYSERFPGGTHSDSYDGEIAFTDQHLGRLLAALDDLGLADDTLVVFLSDHGEEFQEHGGHYHGKTLYTEVTRVPLAIRGPGIEPGRSDVTVSLVDVLPTILELLAQQPPPDLPQAGRSLVPVLRGEHLDERGVLAELRLYATQHANALTLGRWKLIEHTSGDRVGFELFDRLADQGEQTDVADEHPDVVARMAEQLRAQLDDAREAGALFALAGKVELSEEDLQRLRELGYVR